jgi:flagellar protein FliS
MLARAARSYRDADLESAPKTQIVERLFARFARDCADAEAAIGKRDIAAKGTAINHATQIASQLRAALDHSVDARLTGNLDALYRFVIARLAKANLKLDPVPLREASKVMATLGNAFTRAHASLAGSGR